MMALGDVDEDMASQATHEGRVLTENISLDNLLRVHARAYGFGG